MCKVLILDDNENYAKSLKRVMESFNDDISVRAEISTNLEDALNFARVAVQEEKPYTVFLIDQVLGAGKDGIDAMHDLKKVSPYTSFIILTGVGDTEAGIRAYEAGAFRYLYKPVDHSELALVLKAVTGYNARRNDRLRSQKLLKTALEISEIIGTELDIDKIMMPVLEKLQELFQNTALCVLLYDEDKNALSFAPQTLKYYKIHNPKLKNIRDFPLEKKERGSLACKTARRALNSKRQELIYRKNVKSDPDYLPLNPKTTSELCVSLVGGSNLLGVLALEREDNTFKEEDIALVETVAHQLSLAIERSQQSEQLAFKSTVATMTAWASDIAHDINREIGQIRGKAYLIKQNSENAEVIAYAKDIEESAAILNSVGTWSEQNKQAFLLDSYLQSQLLQLAKQRNVKIELNLQTPEVYIEVNPNEFLRVLRHLVRNAARAMDGFCRHNERKILVSSKSIRDKRVDIRFEDYGPGINDQIRLAIFHRKIGAKPNAGGYGLLLVRQMVDDMKGTITLLPAEANKGAIFSIKLPAA